jgi:hypothetical protein
MPTETPAMPVSTESLETAAIHREPLKLGGFLDKFQYFDVTPTIGREYIDANLKEWLEVIKPQLTTEGTCILGI